MYQPKRNDDVDGLSQYAGKSGPGDRRGTSTKINWGLLGAKTANKKSPDSRNLGLFVPNFLVTRLGVEPRTY
jgi:hypothetical protein